MRRAIVERLPDGVRVGYRRTRLLARYHRRRVGDAVRDGRLPRSRGLLLTYPELPTPFHILHKVAASLGYTITDDPTEPVDVAVRFVDRTVWHADDALRAVARRLPVHNLACGDISKSRVNEVFPTVFGYGLGIDPRHHHGQAVAKSEENAAHDGRLVDCPTEPEPGVSYQRLVDSSEPDRRSVEVLRTPIVGDEIPLLYRKIRPFAERFTNTTRDVAIAEPDDVYSAAEKDQLIALARAFGLDVGEVDVLRDRHDGRLYVVDVNATPWGPPRSLPAGPSAEAVRRLAPSYLRLFERVGAHPC